MIRANVAYESRPFSLLENLINTRRTYVCPFFFSLHATQTSRHLVCLFLLNSIFHFIARNVHRRISGGDTCSLPIQFAFTTYYYKMSWRLPYIEKRVTKMQNQWPFKSFNRMLRSNDMLAVCSGTANSNRGGRANVIANYDRVPCAMQLDSFCSLAPCPYGCVRIALESYILNRSEQQQKYIYGNYFD